MSKLPRRDPLVVVKEYIEVEKAAGRTPKISPVRGELQVLSLRIKKARQLFPEYKNLSFGGDIDLLLEQMKIFEPAPWVPSVSRFPKKNVIQ